MKTISNIYQFYSLLVLWFLQGRIPNSLQSQQSCWWEHSLAHYQQTECIPRLIVPPSSESDILINCNNFTQLYQWVAPKYVSIQISSELCFTNISRHTSEIFTSRSKLQVLCYLIVCTYCHLSAVPVYSFYW